MLINTTKYGQLGNRLQLFAHYIAFSIANNQKIINLGFAEYAEFFENTSKDILCRYPPRRSVLKFNFLRTMLYESFQFLLRKRIIEKFGLKKAIVIRSYPFAESEMEFRLDNQDFLNSINNNQIILTSGYYFVDYINLLKHSDRIREYFTPLAIHDLNISAMIKKTRGSCDILVGVHIRRGDYKRFQGGKFYYKTDDFIILMKKMEQLLPGKKVGFLICSDESQDKNLFPALTVTFGTNHIIEDMYSLARCDYIIGTPSTYSRWACFYGNVPTYHIMDIRKDYTLKDFKLFEEIVHKHMGTASTFPRSS